MRIDTLFVVCKGCGQGKGLEANDGKLVDPLDFVFCSRCGCVILIDGKTVLLESKPALRRKQRKGIDFSCPACRRSIRIPRCHAEMLLESGETHMSCIFGCGENGQIPLELPRFNGGKRFRGERTAHNLIAAGRAC